jgi:hypothetical protein
LRFSVGSGSNVSYFMTRQSFFETSTRVQPSSPHQISREQKEIERLESQLDELKRQSRSGLGGTTVKNRAKAKEELGARRKPNPYPGKPRGMPVQVWVESEHSRDRYMARWAARLIRFEADEDGQVTAQRFTPEEAELLTRPRRRSKLLQKRIEQLRARKAAERIQRAKHAAMCRWR